MARWVFTSASKPAGCVGNCFFFFFFEGEGEGLGIQTQSKSVPSKCFTHLGTGRVISSGELLGPTIERTAWWQDLPLDVVTVFGFIPWLAAGVVVLAVAVLLHRNRLLDMRRHCVGVWALE